MPFPVFSVFKKIKKIINEYRLLEVYTDGSCKNGIGSWAYVICKRGQCIAENAGRVRKANSNTMEFQAAIEALKSLPANSKIILYSDSRILVNTMTEEQGPLAHQAQIEVLQQLSREHRINWQWVKAHNGNKLNERCDELCTLARNNPAYETTASISRTSR